MNLRQRLQKSRKLNPVTCLTNGHNNSSILAVRSLTDPNVSYQVRVTRGVSLSSNNIKHTTYTCQCQKVEGAGCPDCQGNSKTVCYHALGAIIGMAKEKGKRVTFYRSLNNAIIKRRITNGSLIQVSNGNGSRLWGVVQ